MSGTLRGNTPAPGFRWADTRLGDSLQDIAARELGEATRWPELVAANGLAPPYIVDGLGGLEDDALPNGRVLLAGTRIKVPASRPATGVADPGDVFGTDLILSDGGALQAGDDGDFLLVTDLPNLNQALRHRLDTRRRELRHHPEYGNQLHELVGEGAGPVRTQLAAAYAKRTLLSDDRVDAVERCVADLTGDRANVDAVAVATDGRALPIGDGSP